MKPQIDNFIQIPIPEKIAKKEPKLYFLSANYESGKRKSNDIEFVDSGCFDISDLCSSIFWNSFEKAEYIVIIDKFFIDEDLDKVIKIMQKNKNKIPTFKMFKLYTENVVVIKKFLNEIKRILADKFVVFEIKHKYIHDRFAILDDELFHFGCTVGGKTSEGFSAFSCGWNADKISMLIKQK
mgnify:CR=1 FL=1